MDAEGTQLDASASDTAPGSAASNTRPSRSLSRAPISADSPNRAKLLRAWPARDLLGACECERPRQWSLEVRFTELNLPAGPVEERDEDAV